MATDLENHIARVLRRLVKTWFINENTQLPSVEKFELDNFITDSKMMIRSVQNGLTKGGNNGSSNTEL